MVDQRDVSQMSAAVRDCPRRIAETNLQDKGPVRLSRAVNILDGFTGPVVLWAFLADTIVLSRPLISHTQTSQGRVPFQRLDRSKTIVFFDGTIGLLPFLTTLFWKDQPEAVILT